MLEKEFGNKVGFVYPSLSISAAPAVTVVGKNVDKNGTHAVAEAYLEFLCTKEAQDIIGKNFYRPISAKAQAQYAKQLPEIPPFKLEDAFGSWAQAGKEHCADGATFDLVYANQ